MMPTYNQSKKMVLIACLADQCSDGYKNKKTRKL